MRYKERALRQRDSHKDAGTYPSISTVGNVSPPEIIHRSIVLSQQLKVVTGINSRISLLLANVKSYRYYLRVHSKSAM
jgi:hypothetical protein